MPEPSAIAPAYDPSGFEVALDNYQDTPPLTDKDLTDYIASLKPDSTSIPDKSESLVALHELMVVILELEINSINRAIDSEGKFDLDEMRKQHADAMNSVFADRKALDGEHRKALDKLFNQLNENANAERPQDLYSRLLVALDRFNKYNDVLIAPAAITEEAAERQRLQKDAAFELGQRQMHLDRATDRFLLDPKAQEAQEGLANQLAKFQAYVLKQEQARLRSEAGIKAAMTAADARAGPMVANFKLMGIKVRSFKPQHYVILEQLINSLLHKASGEAEDPATQQASGVNALRAYIWTRELDAELDACEKEGHLEVHKEEHLETPKEAHLGAQQNEVNHQVQVSRHINYLLAAALSLLVVGLLGLGFVAILPLVAPSLGIGLGLASAVALGLAALAAVLAPIGTFLAAAALRAADQSTDFVSAVKNLGQRVVKSFEFSGKGVVDPIKLSDQVSLNSGHSPANAPVSSQKTLPFSEVDLKGSDEVSEEGPAGPASPSRR